MDLIYTKNHVPVGLMPDCTLDLAFGNDENNFECTVGKADHCLDYGEYLFIEDSKNGDVVHTEFGGIVDGIAPDDINGEMIYKGRTWHGIIEGKVLKPNSGQDYLVLSGDGNAVLQQLINRMGIGDLFKAPATPSGLTITNYQVPRYEKAYTAIRKMLKSYGYKPKIWFDRQYVWISCVPLVDYSRTEQWDSDQFAFRIYKAIRFVNHVIGLGSGTLKDRLVKHLYQDADGNISNRQTFAGLDEIEEVYDFSSVEDEEELDKGMREILSQAFNEANTVDNDFDSNQDYDIGDMVGATSSGITVVKDIAKKVVKINHDGTTITCQIGE